MQIYDHEYKSNNFLFYGGKITTHGILGICINLDDEKIIHLIENNPEKFLKCLKEIYPQVIRTEAHYNIHGIADENGNLFHGHSYYDGWQDYFSCLSFSKLSKLKNQAELVLNDSGSNSQTLNNAMIVLNCLKGDFPPRYIREKSPEEIIKSKFERSKPKLRLKLTIKYGYACDICGQDKENSLCIIRKDDSMLNYDIENLVLRCRACINKIRHKK